LRAEVLACPVLHADETPVQMLTPGQGNASNGRFRYSILSRRPRYSAKASPWSLLLIARN
jgi:hypothetical protein